MNSILWALSIALLLAVGLAAYLLTARKYESPASVAKSYDECCLLYTSPSPRDS